MNQIIWPLFAILLLLTHPTAVISHPDHSDSGALRNIVGPEKNIFITLEKISTGEAHMGVMDERGVRIEGHLDNFTIYTLISFLESPTSSSVESVPRDEKMFIRLERGTMSGTEVQILNETGDTRVVGYLDKKSEKQLLKHLEELL